MDNRRNTLLANPWMLFLGCLAVCSLAFLEPLIALLKYSLANDNASHILVIPGIVAWLLIRDRSKLPAAAQRDLPVALPFAIGGLFAGAFAALRLSLQNPTGVFLLTLSFLLLVVAGFLWTFGRGAGKAVWFDLAFLGFAVPLPEALLNRFIYVLQLGSAEVADWIFNVSGVPFLREGFLFRLAGWNVEVARECSGIRSSTALVILAVLVAHFSFTRLWKKVLFVAAGLLMMVVKNGVRIATLTLLAKFVNPDFLFGKLHHEGGVVFFVMGLGLLLPVYWLLRRGDSVRAARRQAEVVSRKRSEAVV